MFRRSFLVILATALACGKSRPGAPDPATSVPRAPGTPEFLVTGAIAEASWTPPSDNGEAPITGYSVETTGPDGNFHLVATPVAAKVSLSTLFPGSPLYVRVAAINSAGQGAFSAPSAVPLQAPVVTALRALDRGSLGGGCATLEWAPPTFVGASRLAGYIVSAEGTSISASAPPEVRSKTICDLQTHACGTGTAESNFTLEAQNSSGEGSVAHSSSIDACDTPAPWLATAPLPGPAAAVVALGSGDHLFSAGGSLGDAEGGMALGGLAAAIPSLNGDVTQWQSFAVFPIGGFFTLDAMRLSDTRFDSGAVIDRGGGDFDVFVAGSLNPRSLVVSNHLARMSGSTISGTQMIVSSAANAGTAAATGRFYLLGGSRSAVPTASAMTFAEPSTVPFTCPTAGCLEETTPMPAASASWNSTASSTFIYAQDSASHLFVTAVDPATGAPGPWKGTSGPGVRARFTALKGFLYAFTDTTVQVASVNADGTVASWTSLVAPPPFRTGWSLAGAAIGNRLFLYALGGSWNGIAVDVVEFAEVDTSTGALITSR